MAWDTIPVETGDPILETHYDELYAAVEEKWGDIYRAMYIQEYPEYYDKTLDEFIDYFFNYSGYEDYEKSEQIVWIDFRKFQQIIEGYCAVYNRTAERPATLADIRGWAGLEGTNWIKLPLRVSDPQTYGTIAPKIPICKEHVNEMRAVLDVMEWFVQSTGDNTVLLYSRTYTSDWEEDYSVAKSSCWSGLQSAGFSQGGQGGRVGYDASEQRRKTYFEPFGEDDWVYEYKCSITEYRVRQKLYLPKGGDCQGSGYFFKVISKYTNMPVGVFQNESGNVTSGTLLHSFNVSSLPTPVGAPPTVDKTMFYGDDGSAYSEGVNYIYWASYPMSNPLPSSYDDNDLAQNSGFSFNALTGGRYFIYKVDTNSWEYKAD